MIKTQAPMRHSSETPRRVLAVLYQFPPSRTVGAQSCAQICRYLPAHGWSVSVLTVQERYVPEGDRELGDAFPGNVIRTAVIPHPFSFYRWLKSLTGGSAANPMVPAAMNSDSSQKAGALRRWLLPLLGVPDQYLGWLPPAVVSGLNAIHRENIDCIFSSGPWWTNHLIAMVLARITGLPWVCHFRDSWAQGHWIKPANALSIRIETALERAVVRRASAVVCVTEKQTAMLRDAYPDLPRGKFSTIPNGYDDAEWTSAPVDIRQPNDKFVITYAGNLYHGRSPYPLFRALQALIESKQIALERIRVELLGVCDVAEGSFVSDVAASHGLADCVSTPGVLSKREAVRRMIASSLLLLIVDEQNYSIPAKTYEYLRAGRPILAFTEGGAVVDLLKQTGGAWVVDPADSGAIEAAVMEAYSAWLRGADARRPDADVVKGYDRRLLVGRFAELFDRIVSAPARLAVCDEAAGVRSDS